MITWGIQAYTDTIPKVYANSEDKIDLIKLLEPKELPPFPQGSTNPIPEPAKTVIVAYKPPVYATGDAKMFIYLHESGNDPKRWNGSGCAGLGQACPASKLLAVCPNLDYECEDKWFTSYMLNRYKTWENAKAFWLARVPINGKDVGNWW